MYTQVSNTKSKGLGVSVSIDWLGEFEKKFKDNQMIANLKETGFHGKVIINFANGSPNTSHVEWCVKAYNVFTPTSTGGGNGA